MGSESARAKSEQGWFVDVSTQNIGYETSKKDELGWESYVFCEASK
jgi:hypothetical protein